MKKKKINICKINKISQDFVSKFIQ